MLSSEYAKAQASSDKGQVECARTANMSDGQIQDCAKIQCVDCRARARMNLASGNTAGRPSELIEELNLSQNQRVERREGGRRRCISLNVEEESWRAEET